MVKSRRSSSKTLPRKLRCHSAPQALVMTAGAASSHTPEPVIPPGDRNPYHRVRDELGKLKRLGNVLNYSDDQSSDNDVDPASSVSDVRQTPSSSPDPERNSRCGALQETAVCSGFASASAALNGPTDSNDFKAVVVSSGSVSDAALAFQRWRNLHLKTVFSQELKKVLEEAQRDEARLSSLEQEMEKKEQHLVHALADSAQLRAQLCALENISGQHHGSEVEILQEEMVKALERATSSEAEVERYNKEIRKLRERLKSMEDEASRLDSELKASVAFLQKEKDGVAEENRVLLEQLARKDEEVLSQTQEINNLKSVLACMRVSRLELERLKTKLQDNTKQQLEYSKHEMKGNEMLQSEMGLGFQSSKVSVPKTLSVAEGPGMPFGPVFSQLLDLLQKLNACSQKNETYMDPSRVKVQENEELSAARPNIPQKEAMGLDAAHQNKQINCAGQVSSLQQSVNNGCRKTLDTFPTANAIGKLNKLSIVTCWKWRWAAAASEVQALSRELNTLRSLGKEFLDKTISLPPSSFTSGHEKFRSSMLKAGFQSTESQCVKEPQVPLTFDKVFTLLASIWQTSSQSAHLEKEIILKSRQLDHLLHVMTRWMQRASKKRQLEKAIVHWLLYLLQSWRDKFKHHTLDPVLTIAPKPDTRPAATKMSISPNPKQGGSHGHPKRVVQDALHVCGSSDRKSRAVDNCSSLIRKGFRKPEKDAHTLREKALQILQESLHHKLEALEALIIKEAEAWHQQQFGDNHSCVDKPTGEFVNPSSTSASLVWRICGELEHFFIEECNQIMVFFGVVNKVPCYMHFKSENMNPKKCVTACSPKPVSGQIINKNGRSKKTAIEKHSWIQTNAKS